jgi:hypothetical protein
MSRFIEMEASVSRPNAGEDSPDNEIHPPTSQSRRRLHLQQRQTNRPGRRFVFTKFINEVTEITAQVIKNEPAELERLNIRYAVWQVEEAPGTGRLHLQGYIEMTQSCRFRHVHTILGSGTSAWINVAQGNQNQCYEYCTKLATRYQHRLSGPYEVGNRRLGGQGRRNDLDEVKKLIFSGSPQEEIMRDHYKLWHSNWKTIEKGVKLHVLLMPPKEYRTKLRIIIGPPGTGIILLLIVCCS